MSTLQYKVAVVQTSGSALMCLAKCGCQLHTKCGLTRVYNRDNSIYVPGFNYCCILDHMARVASSN